MEKEIKRRPCSIYQKVILNSEDEYRRMNS
jgi:hypothetical protein